ncbi:hypothetical protein HF329_05305 [Chitinophaga oryzae]|uniref:Polymerase/histidinol phosphatase N-terminal domain-containing protein n=1 Tax=Chitinophaga oryzae TaxID=2725414 RepID=A0AAE7SYH6_9BACT|nr:hypothetical protein [Chitinophaga oryzae]QOD67369.1 hypothetical protein HF329_05305 [Chitinophaga oryzae]
MQTNRGSEWRKWDLHFHTPSSYDYQDKSVTNEQIITTLKTNGISVVAITDHHIIDITRIRALQALGAREGIAVLPGIEFLSESRGKEPVHFIGIFSENAPLDYIWTQLQGTTEVREILGLGKAPNEVYCPLSATIREIKKLGGIVTIHAGTKSNTIENITNSLPHGIAEKEAIASLVDIYELGKEEDAVGYRKVVMPILQKKIGKTIPLIICSDNHNANKYKIKQNLWLKAQPSFEGLKQILYEPEQRVKIQFEKPDFKEDRLVIDQVQFVGCGNRFTPFTIKLNENLNVIIGGKSSGKSILLYNIAKTLLADKDFFVREKIENKYNFGGEHPDYNFQITTKGGFSQYLNRDISDNSIIPEIKYIPQNYLVKLAEPDENRKGADLNTIVRDLIKEDQESGNKYRDFVNKAKTNDRKREIIIDAYFDIKSKIGDLEGQLKTKPNKEILEKNIESNLQKLEEINKSIGLTNDQIDEYNKLQESARAAKADTVKINSDFKKILEFNSEVAEILENLEAKKNLVDTSLEHEGIRKIFNSGYSFIEHSIKELAEFKSLFEFVKDKDGGSVFTKKSDLSALVANGKEALSAAEEKLIPFQKGDELKKQNEILNQSIANDKAALSEIEQLYKEISENKKALLAEKNKIFSLFLDNYKEYLSIIEQLKLRTVDLEKDGLKITGHVKFNFPLLRKSILDMSDGRTASYTRFRLFDFEREGTADFEITQLVEDIRSVFDSLIEKRDYVLNRKAVEVNAVKALFTDHFFDFWEIEYKNDKLGTMSTGKASFVILMLIIGLSKSKAPILIDQPEDNLDNRSISSDLVEYLRNKKLERQIILVTHNPNIVVNADAENIIVANQKGQGEVESNSPYQFDYTNGALEDSLPMDVTEQDLLKSMGIREHIAEIVEGGKEAFKKREEKYGFNESLPYKALMQKILLSKDDIEHFELENYS